MSPPRKSLGGFHDKLDLSLFCSAPPSFDRFTDFFLHDIKGTAYRQSTVTDYMRTLETLTEYAPLAAFGDIDKVYVKGYEIYLTSLRLHGNTIVKHFKHLKKVLNSAISEGYIHTSVPELFSLTSVKAEKTYKESLTVKELLTFHAFFERSLDTLPERDREVVGGFLFACYTGFRYSDLCRVSHSDIHRIRGKRWIFLTMRKTSQKVFVPVEQLFQGKAMQLLRLFRRTRGLLFHLPSNAICNRVIKRYYRLAEKERAGGLSLKRPAGKRRGKVKNISFHTARHTAATLLLYCHTPLTTIKGILGHTTVRTTEIYADINEATLYNSVARLSFKEMEKVGKRMKRRQ